MAKRRAQQTRLTFTPLPSSSPATAGYSKQIQERAAAVRYDSPFKRRRIDSSSPSKMTAKTELPPTPELTARTPQDVDSDDDNIVKPHRRSSRKDTVQQQLDFSNATPVKQVSSPQIIQYDTSSDDDVVITKATKRQRDDTGFMSSASKRLTRGSKRTREASPLSEIDEDELVIRPSNPKQTTLPPVKDDEEDSDEMPTSMGTQRKRKRSRPAKDDFIASSDSEEAADNEDDVIVVNSKRRNGKQKVSEDDDDELVTPHRRRLKRPNAINKQEKADLDEDLEFLEPTSDAEDTPRRPRDSQSAKKDKRLQALDALKRKRAGQKELEVVDEEEVQDEEAEYGSDYDSTEGNVPTSSRQFFAAEQEDEDFIAEDEEEGPLGVPDIPIEFTQYASMKAKDLFKYAVEWMIQKRINPGFSAQDELYDLTFKKLNDEVSGLVSSKFSSSAWSQEFTLALRARPAITVVATDTSIDDDFLPKHCDACNRSNHPARYEIKFEGRPYHPETLEEVEQGDENDSDSGSEAGNKIAYDHQGHELAPSNRVYKVGRFCTANAEAAHELHHWRLNLYDFVADWLDSAGYNHPDKVLKRDRMSTAKRRKEANKILDIMAEQGVVKKLWKEFQKVISGARSTEQGRWK